MASPSSSPPPPPPPPLPLTYIPSDVIQNHILSRLDGPSLASFSCASSDFLSLSSDDRLWKSICAAAWPSTADTDLHSVISDFTHGHRSFFSDSYAPLSNSSCNPQPSSPPTTKLISAVDIFYRGAPLFSKVLETETVTPWFMSAPFNIDLIEEPVSTPICNSGQKDDAVLKHLEENLSISWIVVDPASNRSGSICGTRPVSVERHWINGDIQVEYSAVVDVDWKDAAWSNEAVQFRVTVALGGNGGGLMEVKTASVRTEDLDGRGVNGEDSLEILVGAMLAGGRRRMTEGRAAADFGEMKRMRRERKLRREKALDVVCTLGGTAIFVVFCIWLRSLLS